MVVESISIMKHLSLFILCTLSLFRQHRMDSEVVGTGSYNMIEGFTQNNLYQQTQSDNQKQEEPKQSQQEQQLKLNETSTQTSITHPLSNPRLSALNYKKTLARKIGLSTLMMSGVLYGLTVLPAILGLTGSGPLAGLFSSLGRRKRSLVNESHIYRQMPSLNTEETLKFLKLFESTLQARKIRSSSCRRYYTCKVYFSAFKSGEPTTLATLEHAMINVFGIAVERNDYKLDLVPTVKMYSPIAWDALNGKSCALRYPCSLQANKQQDQATDFRFDH